MKTKIVLLLLLSATIQVSTGGCTDSNDDKKEEITYPEAVIIKELPKIYEVASLSIGENRVIRTQAELRAFLAKKSLQTYRI